MGGSNDARVCEALTPTHPHGGGTDPSAAGHHGESVSKSEPPGAAVPRVSVIIPTRDRPEQLRECLAALAGASIGRDQFEVIVVDDGGRRTLDGVAKEFDDCVNFRLLRQPPSGPARARNAGVASARAALVAFTDDDCRPAPAWLEHLLRCHEEAPDVAIGGSVCNSVERNYYSQASQVLLDYLYRRANPDPRNASFFATCNMAAPRRSLLESGGFSEAYPFAAAEDRDFCRRWKKQGGRLVYAPRAVVHHFHTLGLRSFLRQHFRYGRGSRRFRNEAAEATRDRVAFEKLGFYFGIVREPFNQLPLWPALRVAILLGISQVATVLGFVREVVHAAPSTRAEPALSKASETDPAGSGPVA